MVVWYNKLVDAVLINIVDKKFERFQYCFGVTKHASDSIAMDNITCIR